MVKEANESPESIGNHQRERESTDAPRNPKHQEGREWTEDRIAFIRENPELWDPIIYIWFFEEPLDYSWQMGN